MAKIDLSGNSGWQSKTSDKIKSLQNGSYDYSETVLSVGTHRPDWIASGLIIQVVEGELSLMLSNEPSVYEKGQIIYLNEENMVNLEMVVSSEVTLGVFKEKAKN